MPTTLRVGDQMAEVTPDPTIVTNCVQSRALPIQRNFRVRDIKSEFTVVWDIVVVNIGISSPKVQC